MLRSTLEQDEGDRRWKTTERVSERRWRERLRQTCQHRPPDTFSVSPWIGYRNTEHLKRCRYAVQAASSKASCSICPGNNSLGRLSATQLQGNKLLPSLLRRRWWDRRSFFVGSAIAWVSRWTLSQDWMFILRHHRFSLARQPKRGSFTDMTRTWNKRPSSMMTEQRK